MRVLIISPSPPEYLGGLAKFVKNLALNIEESDIKVDILTTYYSKKYKKDNLLGKSIKLIRKKCYFLKDNDNVLHIKNPIFNVLSYLIKHGSQYDLIHIHSYIYFSTFQAILYKLFCNRKIPLLLHLHGGIQTEDFLSSTRLEKILLFFKKYIFDLTIGKLCLNIPDALISVSKDDLLAINRVFRLSRSKHNYYLPNVIDTQKFRRIKKIQKKYIGFIGRLTHIKGIDIFLKFIQNYYKIDNNREYLIIGNGPFLSEVKILEEKYPIIHYDKIPHDKMVDYYNRCLIFTLPSRSEGLPTTILEALACEVPVIAANVGGVSEIITHGSDGFLFDIDHPEKFLKAVKNLLKKDKSDLVLFGKRGRRKVKKLYSWDNIIDKIIKIYKIITD